MSISPLVLPFLSRTFDSAGTLRASITGLTLSDTATLTADGELQGSTNVTISETGALVLGRIEGSTSLSFTANATYSSPLRANETVTIGATATWSALAEIQGSTNVSFTASAATTRRLGRISPLVLPSIYIESSPAIQATKGSTSFSFSDTATLTAKGGLGGNRIFGSTSIDIFTPAFLWLEGKGELAGTADITFSDSVTLRAEGAALGSTSIDLVATANLRGGINALFGGTDLEFTNTGNLLAKGQLQGSTSITVGATGTTLAKGELKGATVIRFLNPGSLISFISAASTFRFTATGTLLISVPSSPFKPEDDAYVQDERGADIAVGDSTGSDVAVGGGF